MMRTSLPLSFLLLLPFIGIVGCSDDTPADPAQTTVTWTKPNAGSTFTYSGYTTDSLGRQTGGGSYTDSVLAHGATARGVSGLTRMTFMDFFQILVDHRANGDFALALEDPDGVESPWTVFPVGSKGSVTREAWSLSLGDSTTGITTWSTPYSTLTYLGAEQRTTPAGTFATHRILKREFDTTRGGDPFVASDTTWFAPAIGTYVRMSTAVDRVGSPTGRVAELSSYTLK